MLDDRADAEALAAELADVRVDAFDVPGPVHDKIAGAIASVQDAIEKARGAWASLDVELAGYAGGTDPAQGLGAVAQIEKNAALPWYRKGYGLVVGDQIGLDKWVAWGNEILDDLRSEAGYSEQTRLSVILWDTTKKTASDVADLPAKIIAEPHIKAILIALLVVILLAVFLRVKG